MLPQVIGGAGVVSHAFSYVLIKNRSAFLLQELSPCMRHSMDGLTTPAAPVTWGSMTIFYRRGRPSFRRGICHPAKRYL